MVKERRGSSRRRVGANSAPGATTFEDLVGRALDTIPAPFSRALDDVAVVIEDEPSREQRREAGLRPGEGLYGLYEGVPRTEYGADWGFVPSKITLFRTALVEDFPDPAELEREVWITVVHELAHFMGISDERLHEMGMD
ncbi:MAG TPA: metallopeptidase family protein [Candidatus Limnocylindrales bacterium]